VYERGSRYRAGCDKIHWMPVIPSRITIQLTDRDLALLRGLFEARLMTLRHAAVFHFNGSVEAATKRVQKLKAAGMLAERPRRAYEPSILHLTRAAFAVLADRGVLIDYPQIRWSNLIKRAQVSDLTLRHELDVLEVRAAFWKRLGEAPAFEIVEFTTWSMLFQFTASPSPGAPEVLVRPDAFIRIVETEANGIRTEHRFFLEVDRSTEMQSTLATKAACYADYYRRGGLAVRYDRPRSEFRDFPFRVLVSCRSTDRRDNAAKRMLQNRPPVLTQVQLTTFNQLIRDPLAAIWLRPADYLPVPKPVAGGTAGKERAILLDRSKCLF
jgi:hypothetical protein